MNFDQRFKLRILERHDEHMSRPVKEIFNKPKGVKRAVVCKGCGEEFIWITHSMAGTKLWCSDKCKDRVEKNAQRMKRKEGPVPDIICKNCGKPTPGNRIGTAKVYCSLTCKKASYYKRTSGPSRS